MKGGGVWAAADFMRSGRARGYIIVRAGRVHAKVPAWGYARARMCVRACVRARLGLRVRAPGACVRAWACACACGGTFNQSLE